MNYCDFDDPVVYTKVSKYTDWIEMAINKSEKSETNEKFLFFGCNSFVLVEQIKPLFDKLRSYFIGLSMIEDLLGV